MGTTLQRRAVEYNLLLTVFIMFLTLGLCVHISNVLRLLHLFHQKKEVLLQKDSTDAPTNASHGHKITINRVLLGVVVAFMLYVFINLAGQDVVQGQKFTPNHQTVFAVVAFTILLFGDLSLEMVCLFQIHYENGNDYVQKSIMHKSKFTCFWILLGVFMLQWHLRSWLCPKLEMNDSSKFCNLAF